MKVLFAVNNEKTSEAIIKKYQSMYKEIISWKNVYFFNAIIKELQKDKSYDRIVIGEDLEPYTNNNYEVIDNFLFDKLDAISDEASNSTEGDIPIILIATDRRDKGDSILVKLFGIGIYNVLLGKDRSMENVCKLINQPRTKKEAKIYYKIESDEVEYQSINPDIVPEDEMNNIIRHYKKIAGNEEQYVSSFEDIASQYTQTQLKIIAAKLPLNVRAVLEEKSPKYQQVMIGSVKDKVRDVQFAQQNRYTAKNIGGTSAGANKIGLINQQLQKSRLTKPVVIPSSVNLQNVEKVYKSVTKTQPETIKPQNPVQEQVNTTQTPIMPMEPVVQPEPQIEQDSESLVSNENNNSQIVQELDDIENLNIVEPKRGRGRPKKEKTPEQLMQEAKPKRGRGRPKKNPEPQETEIKEVTPVEQEVVQQTIDEEPIDLFALSTDENNIEPDVEQNDDTMLPGFEDFDDNDLENKNNDFMTNQNNQLNNDINNSYQKVNPVNNTQNNNYQNFSQTNTMQNSNITGNTNNIGTYNNPITQNNMQYSNENIGNAYENSTDLKEVQPSNVDLSNLLVGDKKIVAFVGTSKNGTSFLVNNLAVLLSQKGIKTAILDLTENKNAYYIYNLNDDNLRNKAFNCIDGLRSGVTDGIPVNKNLTVYTTLPGENPSFQDSGNILETLVKNYSLVLLDCDFKTYTDYFVNAQEIYLVQSYDILTIQPLTAFLNELQHKNALDENKLRIVINKTLKLRKLTEKMIIGGISRYNDPATTYQNTLFNNETIRYTTIPFEEQTYARYLERLVDCEINLNGYSKMFLEALNKLGTMVYPLIANNVKYKPNKNYNDYSKPNKKQTTQFNSSMDATLNKMRRNI